MKKCIFPQDAYLRDQKILKGRKYKLSQIWLLPSTNLFYFNLDDINTCKYVRFFFYRREYASLSCRKVEFKSDLQTDNENDTSYLAATPL